MKLHRDITAWPIEAPPLGRHTRERITLRIPIPADWMQHAACKGKTDLFFPDQHQNAAAARQICGTCPVRAECATYAINSGERQGIWGGKSIRELRAERAAT